MFCKGVAEGFRWDFAMLWPWPGSTFLLEQSFWKVSFYSLNWIKWNTFVNICSMAFTVMCSIYLKARSLRFVKRHVPPLFFIPWIIIETSKIKALLTLVQSTIFIAKEVGDLSLGNILKKDMTNLLKLLIKLLFKIIRMTPQSP